MPLKFVWIKSLVVKSVCEKVQPENDENIMLLFKKLQSVKLAKSKINIFKCNYEDWMFENVQWEKLQPKNLLLEKSISVKIMPLAFRPIIVWVELM